MNYIENLRIRQWTMLQAQFNCQPETRKAEESWPSFTKGWPIDRVYNNKVYAISNHIAINNSARLSDLLLAGKHCWESASPSPVLAVGTQNVLLSAGRLHTPLSPAFFSDCGARFTGGSPSQDGNALRNLPPYLVNSGIISLPFSLPLGGRGASVVNQVYLINNQQDDSIILVQNLKVKYWPY